MACEGRFPSATPWFWEKFRDACAELALERELQLPNNLHGELMRARPDLFTERKAQERTVKRLLNSAIQHEEESAIPLPHDHNGFTQLRPDISAERESQEQSLARLLSRGMHHEDTSAATKCPGSHHHRGVAQLHSDPFEQRDAQERTVKRLLQNTIHHEDVSVAPVPAREVAPRPVEVAPLPLKPPRPSGSGGRPVVGKPPKLARQGMLDAKLIASGGHGPLDSEASTRCGSVATSARSSSPSIVAATPGCSRAASKEAPAMVFYPRA